jgi:hypothetical protein
MNGNTSTIWRRYSRSGWIWNANALKRRRN